MGKVREASPRHDHLRVGDRRDNQRILDRTGAETSGATGRVRSDRNSAHPVRRRAKKAEQVMKIALRYKISIIYGVLCSTLALLAAVFNWHV